MQGSVVAARRSSPLKGLVMTVDRDAERQVPAAVESGKSPRCSLPAKYGTFIT